MKNSRYQISYTQTTEQPKNVMGGIRKGKTKILNLWKWKI